MSEVGESAEIVSTRVNLLHERRLGVYQTVILEYAMDLRNASCWVDDVLEHRLDDDTIKDSVLEREIVPIRNKLRARPERNIGINQNQTR